MGSPVCKTLGITLDGPIFCKRKQQHPDCENKRGTSVMYGKVKCDFDYA